MALTKRQREVLDFINDFVERNEYSPSFEEIGKGLGLSSLATVHKHVTNLEQKKKLTRGYNQSRSIDIVRGARPRPVSSDLKLPLVGRIAAGRPVEAIENPETFLLATSPAPGMYSFWKCEAIRCRTSTSSKGITF